MPFLAIFGVVLDGLLGEPRRAHPLVGFGRCAEAIERVFNSQQKWPTFCRIAGIAAWFILVAAPVAAAFALTDALPWPFAYPAHSVLLWFALGARSLYAHILPIQRALQARQLDAARRLTAQIVSRETSRAGETEIARAAVESTLENGNDAIFGALFWFALAGGPGALAFRLVNTLDAMWGYQTPRFFHFGWAAAKIDDLANYVPARLTALVYALCGDAQTALRCWRTQAREWRSPNAGLVIASGAGSLNVVCGGAARYHGIDQMRPLLGAGHAPQAADIARAVRLVRRALRLWLAVLTVIAALFVIFSREQHRIPIAEKTVALFNRVPVRETDGLHAGKGGHEHEQR